MCHRVKDEPLVAYWLRQFKEEPLRVLILLTLAAIVYLYQQGNTRWDEYREDLKGQNTALIKQMEATTAVMQGMKAQLVLMNGRLEHLEREHEAARLKK